MPDAHLWVEDMAESDGAVVASATMESPSGERTRLWYRVPIEHRSALTKGSDPFLLGTLFKAMRESTGLIVHGEVSPSLLRNLEELQAAWACWRPEKYTKISITAAVEREQPRASSSDAAIVAFSGGVDSSFTAFRHRTGRCGILARDLQAGLMVHGFDIPLDQHDAFERAAKKSAKMLESIDMALVTMATNFRELGGSWEDAHGTAVASCMTLLQGGYGVGLIASTEPYDSLVLPWGSNPLTDRLMSSDAFQIIHDGAAFTRSDKIREIASWPEALRYLRVCWKGDHRDRNCGRCEKCIRTILNFRAVGLGLPDCFEEDVSDRQISQLQGLNSVQLAYLEDILSVAKAASISESWVTALERCVRRNRHRQSTNDVPGSRFRQGVKRIPGARRLYHLVRRRTAASAAGHTETMSR